MAVAVGLEPTMTGLTVRRLTSLATPQDQEAGAGAGVGETFLLPAPAYCLLEWRRRRESNPYRPVYKTDALIAS